MTDKDQDTAAAQRYFNGHRNTFHETAELYVIVALLASIGGVALAVLSMIVYP